MHFTNSLLMCCLIAAVSLPAISAEAEEDENQVHSHHKKGHHWDYLLFTQRWTISVCESMENCLLPKIDPSSWVIHGTWPTKSGSMGPNFCDSTKPFDPSQISPIRANLSMNWPNMQHDSTEDSLWSHEWDKHGTCAASLETLGNELKYFSQGLIWQARYNMTEILTAANIVPSSCINYTRDSISEAIQKVTGKKCDVHCTKVKETYYISDIRTCYNKDLEIMDCDLSPKETGGCPEGALINYPNSVKDDDQCLAPENFNSV